MRTFLTIVLVAALQYAALAQNTADTLFVPPSAKAAALSAVPSGQVADWMAHAGGKHVFTLYAGQNDALKDAAGEKEPFIVGNCFAVGAGGAKPGEPYQDGANTVYVTAYTSLDACAMRVCVDMTAAGPNETVYVVDPTVKRAFGPYQQAGERWLPTVVGDTAYVVISMADGSVPRTLVTQMSHNFRGFGETDSAKALSCNVDIGCVANTTVQELSSAVAVIEVPRGSYIIQGTGSLINKPSTPALEPYLITANHVVNNATEAENADIIWDYRNASCSTTSDPNDALCPHSNGVGMLATDSTLDTSLLQLDTVPVGSYGRAYLGWDNRTPVVGEEIIVMHHPGGTRMRYSHANVQVVDETAYTTKSDAKIHTYYHETKVGYDQGVTEGGSSGSAMLLVSSGYRIAGMLTTGSDHVCGGSSTVNYDYFSSFRHFLPALTTGSYLAGTNADYTYTEPGLNVFSFAINDGASSTTSTSVTLNNLCSLSPTHYMASESPSFTGAVWQAYSTAPSFTLSSATGTKTVYFKVKDASDESALVFDTIKLKSSTPGCAVAATSRSDSSSLWMGDLAAVAVLLAVLCFFRRSPSAR